MKLFKFIYYLLKVSVAGMSQILTNSTSITFGIKPSNNEVTDYRSELIFF